MKTIRESFKVTSTGTRPVFHTITGTVRDIVNRTGIQSGICVVYSHHTTCSVMTQECSFDETCDGL